MTERSSPATPPRTSRFPPPTAPTVSLDTYRGKRVILYFYPAAMTPGCTKQACDFRDSLGLLTAPASWSSACRRTSRPSSPSSSSATP